MPLPTRRPEKSSVKTPTLREIKESLDNLHYQAWNMSEPWLLDVEKQMRWLLDQYLRPTLSTEGNTL